MATVEQQAAAHSVKMVEYVLEYDAEATTSPAAAAPPGNALAPVHSQKHTADASVSLNTQAARLGAIASTGHKRMQYEDAEAPELVQLRSSDQDLRGKLDSSQQEVERLEALLDKVGAQHSRALQDLKKKHRAQLAAAEALEAERARSTQLQQQLAELSASSTLQQRGSQAQLTDAQQHLAASTDEFKRLDVQLQQAQEELASRDADVAQLQGELNKANSAAKQDGAPGLSGNSTQGGLETARSMRQ